MQKIYTVLFTITCLIVLQGCSKTDKQFEAPADVAYTPSNVATDWMQVYRNVVQIESKNPPHASRAYAYGAIGLYQSILPGLKGYRSLEGQVPGLVNMPSPELLGAIEYITSANEAMYQVANKIFVSLKPESVQLIEGMYKKYSEEMSKRIPADLLANSKQYGARVAASVLDRANNDGFATTRSMSYTVPSRSVDPSFWAPTGAALNPLEPFWGKLKCFAMADGSACTIPSSISFSMTPGSTFYEQAKEVYVTSANLTADQKAIAEWWADNAGVSATPPGHWVGIANIVARQENVSLAKAAETYAALNLAMADAFISCWDEKYKMNLLRPVTYIRNYIAGAGSWTPLLATPPFPEYPSGHSVSSGAAADILTKLYGNIAFTDTSNIRLGLQPRRYNSFDEAATEAAISRLYGGIHYREAIENGLKQGKEVSKAINEKIKMRY